MCVTVAFSLSSLPIFLFLLLNHPQHLLLLAFQHLSLLDPLHLPLLNLLNNDSGSSTLGFLSKAFPFVLGLEGLEPLDFHHQVKALLLIDPFGLELLVLLQLLVPHSHNLRVKRHLVHVFHIIVLLVELLLGFGQEAFGSGVVFDFNLAGRQFLAPGTVHLHHFRLTCLGCSLLLGFLLLLDPSLGLFLFLSHDLR